MFHSLARWLLCALLLTGCSHVKETTLANGLRVIVKEDHRSPVVVSQIWYKVGGQDEPKGLSGMSHVLEHMMFKGTKSLKPNEFSRIIAENGGRENAFTSYDYTAYFQQLEKSRLPISFKLEADRMHNLVLNKEEFGKEVKVVMEERRLRTEDKPEALTFERLMATAYQVHPYRRPIIGWMRDLEHMGVGDLQVWYEHMYTPKNAALVVVGDVQPEEVFALAKKYYGQVPARPVVRQLIPPEPMQEKERRARVAAPAEVPYMVMGFHVPVISGKAKSWEPYALSVLAGILDGGNSARFARELVRGSKVAASASVGYDPVSRAPSLLLIDGTPANGHTIEELERALLEQLERLKTDLVSEEELARIKAQVVASKVYGRDSMFYQAMRLGQLATTELDLSLLDEEVDRIKAITAEQVRDVAQKYLVARNRTVAVLDPQPIGKGKPRRDVGAGSGHVH